MAMDDDSRKQNAESTENDVSAPDMNPHEIDPHYVESQEMPMEGEVIEPAAQSGAETDGSDNTPSSMEDLRQELAQAQHSLKEYQETMLRLKAEEDNLRRRMQRDVENAHKYALERFVNELLPVKDSLEMGLEAASKPEATVDTLREGTELILKMLQDALGKFGVAEINPQNEKFNPEWHEAMTMLPAPPETEPGTVMVVHRKGYTLNDRLVRPAQVVVAQGQ